MHAADAEDKDYERRLLKVGAQGSVFLPMNLMLFRLPGWWSRRRKRSGSWSRCGDACASCALSDKRIPLPRPCSEIGAGRKLRLARF
jgi:hypothetical protein